MRFTRDDLKGNVLSVMGLISPSEMGVTLTHEHLLCDITCIFNEPREAAAKRLGLEALSFKNVGYVRYHVCENRDNLLMLDEDLAIEEIQEFVRAGGGAVVDATNVDLGRDPRALKKIAITTGLKVIMGSGYYVKAGQLLAAMERRDEKDIAREIVEDIYEGVKDTGVHAGLIGEIGCSWPLEDCERKVLRAAGMAQRETGGPLMVHPGRNRRAPFEIIEILRAVGADLKHTVISHIDRTLFEAADRYELLKIGCYLDYDEWGTEGYYPETLSTTDILNDTQRIAQIKDMIEKGFGKQILLSHDICYKCRYKAFGGHGYGHLLNNAVPSMRRRGLSEEEIGCLLVENPKTFFVFA